MTAVVVAALVPLMASTQWYVVHWTSGAVHGTSAATAWAASSRWSAGLVAAAVAVGTWGVATAAGWRLSRAVHVLVVVAAVIGGAELVYQWWLTVHPRITYELVAVLPGQSPPSPSPEQLSTIQPGHLARVAIPGYRSGPTWQAYVYSSFVLVAAAGAAAASAARVVRDLVVARGAPRPA